MKQPMVYKDTNLTVTQALDQMISGMSGETPFNVDCGDCHACCVTYQWTDPLMESVKGEGDKWVCTKLHQCGETVKCSIYADRPPACKHFGCHYQSFGMINALLVKHGAPIFVFHIRSLDDLLRAFEVMFSSSILSHGHVFQGEGCTIDIDSFAGYVIGEVSKIRGVLTPDMYNMLPVSIRDTLHCAHTLPELYEVMASNIWINNPFKHMLRAVHKALKNENNTLKQHLLELSAQGETLIVGGSKSGRTTTEVMDIFDILPDLPRSEDLVYSAIHRKIDKESTVTFERYCKVGLIVDSEKVTVYAPTGYDEMQVFNTLMTMWEQILELKSIHSAMRVVCSAALTTRMSPMSAASDVMLMGVHGDERTHKQALIHAWLYLHRSEYPWVIRKPDGFDLILGE